MSLNEKSLGDWLYEEIGISESQYASYWADFCSHFGDLEAEKQKLREQRDAANAQIQMLNSIIAGDVE